MSKEDDIIKLYTTIKDKFEQDGVLQEVRCLLQSKIIAMIKGKNQSNSVLQETRAAAIVTDTRMILLNKLILEYLHWHGLYYSAEMFSMESSCENVKPLRQCLEETLGNFYHKDVPILLQLVATLLAKRDIK